MEISCPPNPHCGDHPNSFYSSRHAHHHSYHRCVSATIEPHDYFGIPFSDVFSYFFFPFLTHIVNKLQYHAGKNQRVLFYLSIENEHRIHVGNWISIHCQICPPRILQIFLECLRTPAKKIIYHGTLKTTICH